MRRAVLHRDWGETALNVFVGLVLVFLALPTFAVIPMAFSSAELLIFPPPGYSTRWFQTFFQRPEWYGAAINSFIIAVLTTCAATTIGTAAAVALARGGLRLKGAIGVFFMLPMMVPAIVTGVALYRSYAAWGLAGTIPGMVLAHTVVALPFVVINVSAVLNRMDWRLEQAARSLGANAFQAFLRVTLPIVKPGVMAGALFAFLTSFDEVVVALFMTGVNTVTLPVQMWMGIRFEINPIVAAVSVMLVLLSALVFSVYALIRRSQR
jgi:putative spermidine/putrescine transport system permease protein